MRPFNRIWCEVLSTSLITISSAMEGTCRELKLRGRMPPLLVPTLLGLPDAFSVRVWSVDGASRVGESPP